MKKHFYSIFALFLVGAMFSCQSPKSNSAKEETAGIDSMAPNPFITHMYTADPSAHVWADGRLYVYASHDIDPPRGCDLMDRYHVFSTDDMVNWTDHGTIPVAGASGIAKWADCSWAPCAAHIFLCH